MDGYNHYIRVDQAGTIVYGFSSAFEQPQYSDILIQENGPRHFSQVWSEPLTNERGQYRFKWQDGQRLERSQAELDAEWAARPLVPPTTNERIAELEGESIQTMLAVAEVYETATAADTAREEEAVNTMLGLAEAYDTIIQQQARIDALEARLTALEGGES